jgi:CTP:molybdopterin cytidylyltransferase MocA
MVNSSCLQEISIPSNHEITHPIRSMHVTAIIAAAGEGRRLGAGVPKQLLDVGGAHHPRTQHRRLRRPRPRRRRDRRAAAGPGAGAARVVDDQVRAVDGVRIVAGGARRQDSVANAFESVSLDSDVVLIHDAARPFVSADLISRAIDAAAEHGAAIAAVPVRDTVKRVESSRYRPRDHRHDSARHDLSGADPAGVPARRASRRGGGRTFRRRGDR